MRGIAAWRSRCSGKSFRGKADALKFQVQFSAGGQIVVSHVDPIGRCDKVPKTVEPILEESGARRNQRLDALMERSVFQLVKDAGPVTRRELVEAIEE